MLLSIVGRYGTRHIHSTGTYALTEIDDVIERGSWEDWLAMREVAA